ncbi:MAG TPA: HTH domain-containing protein [Candidatus Nanoarchaeia archaeon]|nr:HTH domain-containing protein [Candidatus Nanoarchaeia archaeon]
MGADDQFRDSIKQAFSKVKDDILRLEAELSQNKALLESLRNELSTLRSEASKKETEANLALNTPLFPMESNNQTIKQSNNQTQKHTYDKFEQEDFRQKDKIKQNNPFEELKKLNIDISKIFENLTKKEFNTFLLIYQLVEEQGSLTYKEIGQKLNISSSAVRSYISTSIQKGVPIIKKKMKDNTVVLTLDPSFLGLNLKEKLISYYYYKRDPTQTTLN